MATDVPAEFYECVDRFIGLANEMVKEQNVSRVSAVLLFAATRFNAHCLLSTDPKAMENRDAAVEYLVQQYRTMLKDNIDRLLSVENGRPD